MPSPKRSSIRVALDVMGGDLGPREAVRAAALISKTTTIHVLLVGQRATIEAELAQVDHDPSRLQIVDASEVITMDEKPRDALAAKPDASLLVAMRAVAEGDADALVSAGSTGALVLAAAQVLPRIPGIERSALAAVYPTRKRTSSPDPFALLLDVGATVRVRARDLLFFAYMGHAYASRISKVARPTIGLLNMGSEPTKGDEVLREAHRLLAGDPLLNFVGNVEGNDIPTGGADVIVCEGYVGNVALKMAEGVTEVLRGLGKQAFKARLGWRLGLLLLASGLRQLKTTTDYREYGGAPLLGFRAPVIKAHGRSGASAIANAIKVAAKAARDGVCQEIERAVAGFLAREGGDPGGPGAS
ncbi:MAG: phosphate acyltransferase PlsX [Myxococcales bacterium]|nr:phosphate acyltransferase PlsX [Myxococcales bacterium]MCB9703859.1 phosphate acyltransferase PlsX [Myxococcales bacterium]